MNDQFYARLKDVFSTPNDAKTEEQVKLEENISNLKYYIKGLLERAYKLNVFGEDTSLQTLQYIVEESLKRYIELESKPWLKDKLTVGFLGHMNSGKTTALNCLFKESFPTSNNECTALATYLSFGNNSSDIKLVDKQGNCQTIAANDSSIFDYNVSGGFPYARFFDYIQKENSNPLLKNISVLDTPGLFSSDESHSLPTINAIPLCDIIFWFAPVNGGFDNDNIKFIKDNISDKKLYLVFTYTDKLGFRPNEVDESIAVALEYAKSVDLDVKGYFKFGKKEKTQANFNESVLKELQSIVSNEEIANPIGVFFAVLSQTLEIITERCVAMHKLKSEVEKDREQCMASLRRSTNSFCNAFNTLNNSYSNMISTFNRRCNGALGCGGASSAMATHINQCVNNINALSSAYNDIDFDDSHNFGILCAKESLIDNDLTQMEELKKEFETVLNSFSNNE